MKRYVIEPYDDRTGIDPTWHWVVIDRASTHQVAHCQTAIGAVLAWMRLNLVNKIGGWK